jgi:adenylate kinase
MIRSVLAALLCALISVSFASAQPVNTKVILLVGPPGSGKTTQARFLANKYGIAAFSMADLLKREMASRKKDNLSKALAASIASGELVPDDVAVAMIRTRLLNADLRKGFVLDGFPATAPQAKALDQMLEEQDLPKPIVVVLDAPDDVIRKRLIARRRADDQPENIDRRIREFRDQAALLVGWASRTRVVRVNATASAADVSKQITAGLEKAWEGHTLHER